jgi:hypothetical protein
MDGNLSSQTMGVRVHADSLYLPGVFLHLMALYLEGGSIECQSREAHPLKIKDRTYEKEHC